MYVNTALMKSGYHYVYTYIYTVEDLYNMVLYSAKSDIPRYMYGPQNSYCHIQDLNALDLLTKPCNYI